MTACCLPKPAASSASPPGDDLAGVSTFHKFPSLMTFLLFHGEVVDIDPTAPWPLAVLIFDLLVAAFLITMASRLCFSELHIPTHILRYLLIIELLGLIAIANVAALITSIWPLPYVSSWISYALHINIMLACSLLELEILKIFSVLSATITPRAVTIIQAVLAISVTSGLGGHYMKIFLWNSDQDWASTLLLIESVTPCDLVATMGSFPQRFALRRN